MAEELSCLPAIGGRGISSAAPILQGEAFQLGDNFMNDRITNLGQFEARARLDRVSDRQHLQEKTYDKFRG
jgi:hypothetical protein